MARRIRITTGSVTATATLLDNEVADAIWAALPLDCPFDTWGDEIYFDTGVNVRPEQSRATVDLGDLGYWPPGKAFCIFYGETPMSAPGEIRPASPVGVFGKVDGDPTVFRRVRARTIRVEREPGGG